MTPRRRPGRLERFRREHLETGHSVVRGQASSVACFIPRCPCNGSLHRRSRSVEQSKADTSPRWRELRARFLARPGNQDCKLRLARRCTGKGETVDHIRAPRGDMTLYWDESNLRSACNACNAAREIREGFGLNGSWYQRRHQGRTR